MKRKQWIVIGGVILAAVTVIVIMMQVIRARGNDGISPPQEHTPKINSTRVQVGNETPDGAVAGVLAALRDWDMGVAAQWMTALPDGVFSEAYHGILAPTLERIEFQTGACKITGDTAIVDVSVTAVDLGAALGDLTADAAGYLLTCTVDQSEPVWADFLTGYVNAMDIDNLLRVKRSATAHLVRDTGGKWRIDASDPENAGFLNAVTGGLLDVVEVLGTVKLVL